MITRMAPIVVVISISLLASLAPAGANGAQIQVELPEGWQPRTPPMKNVLQFAFYPDLDAYFELLADQRSDLPHNVDLQAWAKLVKEASAKTSNLVNREETQLKAGRVAGQPTVEYEVTGELSGEKLHYRVIMLVLRDQFCKLACWTTPDHWTAAQLKFEEVVSRLR